jgi:hypothetical protein
LLVADIEKRGIGDFLVAGRPGRTCHGGFVQLLLAHVGGYVSFDNYDAVATGAGRSDPGNDFRFDF